jgi:cytochrome P450
MLQTLKVVMPGKDELQNLTYTVNVLKESLRKYTLVPMVTRVCVKDDTLDGQPIPVRCCSLPYHS